MKTFAILLFVLLFATACTPRIGAGIGGVVISDDGVTSSEILADTQTGIHGNITMGSDIRL